ncbi:isopenicillin N synthase family dioxygenase [Streptomyces atratus]|uniref:isopenicillin N synthase family dioxygenase n=1 Tax=Streptomyces atratus TaxID=1893 RepID=UPI00224D5E98|nr:2OG-Fe(II) oxygenase family protein [Streptomyces atratus]MCX5339128.1 isopenicillin N synthase family oxygenase [Streptomyces atratus]
MSFSVDHANLVDGYVPVIDLSGAWTKAGELLVSQAIGSACENSGFFTVVGHGVDQHLIDRMYAASRAFFERPAEEKAAVGVSPGTHGFYVNAGSASKSLGHDGPPDLNEVFITSVRGDKPAALRAPDGNAETPWGAANRWPAAPEEFRAVWLEYMAAMERLATDLIRLFALSLGLDRHFFDDKIGDDMSTLAANYYCPLTEPPLPGQLRKGAHTDWGNLTILYQDGVGGLEVEQKGHGWREVPCTQGSFVVNIGDLMAFWTAGRWVSTLHRVRIPVDGQTEARISIPFFHMPNHDAPIEPLFPFTDSTTEERFHMATTPGEWYQERLAAMVP